MEVVGAVASIAGIASLAGQALSGLTKLFGFFEDCRSVSRTADRFLREVKSLMSALKDVEMFVARAETLSDALRGTDLVSLSIHIQDCSTDIEHWVRRAEESTHYLGRNSKYWFKKFLAVVKKQSVRDVFEEIESHRSTIMLSLSATGRLLDAYNCSQADLLFSKVDEATSYGKVTVEALSHLEGSLENPKNYEQVFKNARSLSSIASAVTRIESIVSQRMGPPSSASDASRCNFLGPSNSNLLYFGGNGKDDTSSIENLKLITWPLELDKFFEKWPSSTRSYPTTYMKQYLAVQACRTYVRMLSMLGDIMPPKFELEDLLTRAKDTLKADAKELAKSRKLLWNAGHDLESLDQLLSHQFNDCLNPPMGESSLEKHPSPTSQLNTWWDLAALPEEAIRHRAMLPNGERLGEEEWARLVLKFWPLDDAAPRFELSTCSTNGAINSAGACHSARVLLSAHPFDEHQNDLKEDGLAIREKLGVDLGNEIPYTARASKRKRETSDTRPY